MGEGCDCFRQSLEKRLAGLESRLDAATGCEITGAGSDLTIPRGTAS